MTLTCGRNAYMYMYMYFGFDFFQIGNHTKNDCPLSIISCPFLSVGCNTKVCFLHFLSQSSYILLNIIVLLFSVLERVGPLWLVALPFAGRLHLIGHATLLSKESAEIGRRCFILLWIVPDTGDDFSDECFISEYVRRCVWLA